MNEIAGLVPVFLAGAAGVVVVEAAKFAAASMGQRAGQKTKVYKRGTYWVGLVVLVVVAGFVTTITVGEGPIKLLNALQVGINAPALVTAWATASQRDALAKQRRTSAGISPNDAADGYGEGSRSVFRRILNDQAW